MVRFRFLLLLTGVLLVLILPTTYRSSMAVLGYADWDCRQPKPYGWVRSDYLLTGAPDMVQAIAVHEEQHVADYLSFDSCRTYRVANRLGGKDFKKYLEARAYCASARVTFRSGRHASLEQAITYWARSLALPLYDFGFTLEEAEDEIRAYCPDNP